MFYNTHGMPYLKEKSGAFGTLCLFVLVSGRCTIFFPMTGCAPPDSFYTMIKYYLLKEAFLRLGLKCKKQQGVEGQSPQKTVVELTEVWEVGIFCGKSDAKLNLT